MKIIQGKLATSGVRLVLIASRFNDDIVENLIQGAIDALKSQGIEEHDLCLVKVPGAFELPLVARRLAQSEKYDAIIALGAVIRGQTAHFEYVAGECNAGLSAVCAEFSLPIANGVLTVNNREQAIDRSGPNEGNKGAEAARVALEMVNLLKQLEQ